MKPQIENTKMNKLLRQSRLVKAVLFLTSILLIVMMTGSLYFRDRVFITDNGVTTELMISSADVDTILQQGGFSVGSNDRLTYRAEDAHTAYLTITRAYDVIVCADGKEIKVPVIDGTAEQVLSKAGITLGENDYIDCGMQDEVYEGMKITVTRVNYRLRATTAEIPFETIYVDNSNMVIGEERVAVQGDNGVRTYVIKEKYIDGVLSGQELTHDNIEKPAVARVIERGTAL
ncbi:MAG: G5 domain-containing protein, partial [Oscillospiraceae bacterium]